MQWIPSCHRLSYGAAACIGLVASDLPSVAAQSREKAAAGGWKAIYPPDLGEFNTPAERAAAMATMEEVERILWQRSELAHPQGFRVMKQVWGGTRTQRERGGLMMYSFYLWFFEPGAREGMKCITVHVNPYLPVGSQGEADERGRPFSIEPEIGETFGGATIVHQGLRWDSPTADRRSGLLTFTAGGVFPWIPVTREEYLRTQIYAVEGKNGEVEKEFRRSLETTTYEKWMAGALERKKTQDEQVAAMARYQGKAAADEFRKEQEQTERQITQGLKAEEDEERKRNQEVLAHRTGDELRAQIATMTPAERAAPATASLGGQLVGPDDPTGHRVLTPEPEFWRVRRAPAEVHAINVGFHPSMTCGAPAVREALWKVYQTLDWAAFKRMVDRPW